MNLDFDTAGSWSAAPVPVLTATQNMTRASMHQRITAAADKKMTKKLVSSFYPDISNLALSAVNKDTSALVCGHFGTRPVHYSRMPAIQCTIDSLTVK